MEISYGHDAKDCYMIYKMENKKLDYRYEVMEKISIQGLLPVCRVHINSEIQLKYKITSRDKVSELIGRNQFTAEMFHIMINTLEEIRKEFIEYFLDMDNLILNVDNIYYNRESGEFEYCYCPDYQCEYNKGILNLLENLMQKITYSDRELIGSVYEMHNRIVHAKENKNNSIANTIQKENANDVNTNDVNTNDIESNDVNTNNAKMNKESEKADISSLSNYIKKIFRGKKYQGCVCEEEKTYEVKNNQREKSESQKEENMSKNEKTVLLSELMASDTRKLCPINHSLEFVIKSYPFMIGKNTNEVEGVIVDPSISKVHARITNEEGEYWIEDLNSRNGTFVNNQRIEPYQTVNIKLGDKIEFSKYGFVFR